MDIESDLVEDGVGAQCAQISGTNEIEVTTKAKITHDALPNEIPNHEALVVKSASQVTKDEPAAGVKLEVEDSAGAGVDNIDVKPKLAGKRRIGVFSTPGANAISVCEYTCGLIISVARHIVPAAMAFKEGRWEREKFIGNELYGKTLAIIGLGRVGRGVAFRMHSFGMKILGYDQNMSAAEYKKFHIIKMELDEIWPQADYITLHIRLNETTFNMINANVLKRCKKGVKIVNVARGGLINERDLLDALNASQVTGAAIDLYERGPPVDPLTLMLVQHPAVLPISHLGALSKEAQIRLEQEIVEQLVNPDAYFSSLAGVSRVLKK